MPTPLDGEETGGVALVERLNELAGAHGIGRIDHMEDRLVGIKSREVYEAPAAVTLGAAHQALERLTLSKPQLRTKAAIAREYADLIYDGLWFTAHHQDIASYVQSSQRHVTGTIRLRLNKGQATAVGSKFAQQPLRYGARHLRRGRPVRPVRREGLHPRLGSARPCSGSDATSGPIRRTAAHRVGIDAD